MLALPILTFRPREQSMETTRLSSKGQVVLPKSIREAHRLEACAEFVVEDRPEGILLRPLVRPFARTRVEDVLGCAGYRGLARTIEEMDAAIAMGESAARRADSDDRDWHERPCALRHQ